MKRTFVFLASALLFSTVQAQDSDSDSEVVLPPDAQKCVLPASPDAIPEEATYEELVAAKAQVAEFQGKLADFRTCLEKAGDGADITDGNKQAITASYNYSVEMEERVANRFNDALHAYKERQKSTSEG